MKPITFICFIFIFVCCDNDKQNQKAGDLGTVDEISVVDSRKRTEDTLIQRVPDRNKLSVLVLPSYDEIANRGISPDLQKFLENEIQKDSNLTVTKLPFKKLMGVPYQHVFDKKYCKPVLEKIKVNIIVMSKLDLVRETGNIFNDCWKVRIRIYNVDNDVQITSKVKSDSIRYADIAEAMSMKQKKLIREITSTIKKSDK
jgi:hypothetical protein